VNKDRPACFGYGLYGKYRVRGAGKFHSRDTTLATRGAEATSPSIAFDGDSQAVLNCKQRNGMTCSSTEVIDFYLQSKRRLPQGVKLGYVRADKGFSGQELA